MGKTTAALLILTAMLVVLLPGTAAAATDAAGGIRQRATEGRAPDHGQKHVPMRAIESLTPTVHPQVLTPTVTPVITSTITPVVKPAVGAVPPAPAAPPAADVMATDVEPRAADAPSPPAEAPAPSPPVPPVQVAAAAAAAPVPLDPPPTTTTTAEPEHVIATEQAAVLAPALQFVAGDRLQVLGEQASRTALPAPSARVERARGSLAATGTSTDDLLVIGLGLVGVGVIFRRFAGRSP
jgi:hypothetical protein